MKKFLFTLAALLMAVSAYAECYIYIDANDFTVTKADIENQTEIDIPVRAHFSARASGFEWSAVYPEGMTVVFMEKGADCDVQGYNSRGRATTFNAALYGVVEPYDHIVGTLADNGYWQNPDSENPTAWVTYGVAKWEAGDYEEFLLITAVFDENYHGGEIITTTACSSGRDERGGTVTDNGDQSQFFEHSSGELEDPNPAVQEKIDVAAPVISYEVGETTVTVTIEWPTTDGQQVYTGEYTYNRTYEDQSFEVEAYTTETDTYKESVHATETINVPAMEKADVAAPVISYEVGETTVTVTITWPESDGTQVYTGQYTYDRTYENQSYEVEAYVTEGETCKESAHATETINVPAMQQPTATDPEIIFEPVVENEVVVAVDVTVNNATEYTIYVNDVPLRATRIEANYNENKVIRVVATNDPGYPYLPNTKEDTYTLNKLEKKDVAAPVINQEVGNDAVTVTIEWPESDGEHIYNGQNSYERLDEAYEVEVEAYVAEGETCNESEHATATIVVPAKEQQPLEETAAPSIAANAKPGENGGHGYYEVVITPSDPESVCEYRVKFEDGEWSNWMTYEEALAYATEGSYVVEARAKAEGKDYSRTVSVSFVVTDRTGLDEINGEKSVANVRFFNLAGQEMQEANGMTIVVTTYTDGTTSAVKVMK